MYSILRVNILFVFMHHELSLDMNKLLIYYARTPTNEEKK